jgi:hypothetical protein
VVREMRLEFPFQETSSDDAVIDTIASLGEYAVDVNPDFGLLIRP